MVTASARVANRSLRGLLIEVELWFVKESSDSKQNNERLRMCEWDSERQWGEFPRA
jgi:hypothetical protein